MARLSPRTVADLLAAEREFGKDSWLPGRKEAFIRLAEEKRADPLFRLIEARAATVLGRPGLVPLGSDRLDFFELGCGSLEEFARALFEAGAEAGRLQALAEKERA